MTHIKDGVGAQCFIVTTNKIHLAAGGERKELHLVWPGADRVSKNPNLDNEGMSAVESQDTHNYLHFLLFSSSITPFSDTARKGPWHRLGG